MIFWLYYRKSRSPPMANAEIGDMASDTVHRSVSKPPSETARVSVTVRIPLATFKLLQDSALAHTISGVANRIHGTDKTSAATATSVAAVIEAMIERDRKWLEREAALVRGSARH